MPNNVKQRDPREQARMDNIRYSRPGRPLGQPDLTEKQRAAIYFDKLLGVETRTQIAVKHNVGRWRVTTIDSTLSDEAKQEVRAFVDRAQDLRDATMRLAMERVESKTLKDNVLAPLINVTAHAVRLEKGQSTQNVNIHLQTALANWRDLTNPTPELLQHKLESAIDSNGLNAEQARELRAAILPEDV